MGFDSFCCWAYWVMVNVKWTEEGIIQDVGCLWFLGILFAFPWTFLRKCPTTSFIYLSTYHDFNILLSLLEPSFATYEVFLFLYIPFVKTDSSSSPTSISSLPGSVECLKNVLLVIGLIFLRDTCSSLLSSESPESMSTIFRYFGTFFSASTPCFFVTFFSSYTPWPTRWSCWSFPELVSLNFSA